MLVAASQSAHPAAIRVDLGAIFVSMELSRAKWLITSLSPGAGEKLSKHVVTAGALPALQGLLRGASERRKAQAPVDLLVKLKGIGPEFAAVLWTEGFFRHFDNRRQVAAYAGLAPTPWKSGGIDREQGVSKAGNPRLRATLIQLSWLWLRHQPNTALARWFEVAKAGGRGRKTAIVALARKLLVALWKYVGAGVAIEGAVFAA